MELAPGGARDLPQRAGRLLRYLAAMELAPGGARDRSTHAKSISVVMDSRNGAGPRRGQRPHAARPGGGGSRAAMELAPGGARDMSGRSHSRQVSRTPP